MIAIRDLSALDSTLVNNTITQTEQRLVEDNPNLDLRFGALYGTVVYYNALLAAAVQTNVNDYLAGRSLRTINENPGIVPDSYVDDVLSNFRVTRKVGANAEGEVVIIRDNAVPMTIATGAVFEANGKQFVTTTAYTAKPDIELISSDTDRLITQLDDGTYAFTVPVIAIAPGTEYRLEKDTTIVPVILPTGFITARAAGDFLSGTDTETNEQLISRLQQGIAAKAPSNRVNMLAMLKEYPAFEDIVASSIIGYGDAEMDRDRHWLWPVSGGGRIDWYIRSEPTLTKTALTVDATLVTKADNFVVWQFTLPRDTAAGVYEVANIRRTGSSAIGGMEILTDLRQIDLSGPGFKPDIVNVKEVAYSRFQTITITFKDTAAASLLLATGTAAEFEIELRKTTLVSEVQDILSSRDVRGCATDTLVKAAVPCFVRVNVSVSKSANQPDPNIAAIKSAVCDVVNGTGFTGALYASAIYRAIQLQLPTGMSASNIDILGRIRYPDGTNFIIRNSDVVRVPSLPLSYVSEKTVQFYAAADDVTIGININVPADA